MPKESGKREKTISFVCELPLKATQQQEIVLLTRLEAGRQLYNACLGEAMLRLNADFGVQRLPKSPNIKKGQPSKESTIQA